MPPQPCNVLLMLSRLYWYQGVSLLHYQALLGATLVNGEDQRATWAGFFDLAFLTTLESALKSFQGWRTNTERLIQKHFFWRFRLWNPKSLSPKKLSWRMGLKKNTCRFPKPWPCSPLFRSLQIAGFAFISMNTPRQKLKFITNEGEAMFQVCCNAVCFLLRIESVASCVAQQSNFWLVT